MRINFTLSLLLCICFSGTLPACLSAQGITSFTPTSGRIGTPVTITGTGFDPIAANNTVYFGGVKANVNSASATQLVVTAPTGATFQPITVTRGGITSYSSSPFITTFGCAPTTISASSFGAKLNMSGTIISPLSIIIADFDNDGKPDIAATTQDNNSVAVFKNISNSSTLTNASFAPAVNFFVDPGPLGIVAGDIDGDGKMDIAVTTATNTVGILRNTSVTGSITATSFMFAASFATSTGPTDDSQTSNIAIGDLDGDGKPDLAVTNSNKNTFSIFRNLSTPGIINNTTFSPRTDIATGATPIGIVVADLDVDGRPEIAISNAFGASLMVFRNISSPGAITFATRVTYGIMIGAPGLAAGDLNNDGKPELVVTNAFDNSISIFTNNATVGVINGSTLVNRFELSAPVNPLTPVITDFNGDGKPDIMFSSYDQDAPNSLNNPTTFYANNIAGSTISSGSFLPRLDLVTGGSLGKVALGDLDADGKPELVVPNYDGNLVSVFKNNASIYNTLPPATLNGLNTVCDDGVWKNYYDPANFNRIICSIRDDGNTLGSVNARVYVDATLPKYNTTTFLGRHYLVTPGSQPTGNIHVRLYFSQADFNALQVADNRINSPEELSITKYQGPTEDGVFNPADASSLSIIPPSSISYGTLFGNYYAEITVNSLSEFWFHYGAVVLPVKLLYFRAEKAGDAVSLQWSTAMETNNDYFTIERSQDASSFASIGTVKAGGATSQPRIYEFKDAAPATGLNYYRLKQTDKDGKSTFSDIKVVDWKDPAKLRIAIAPQPLRSSATVSFYAKSGANNFMVYNAQGAVVQTYRVNMATNGNTQLSIRKDGLPAGVYFFKIINNNQELYKGKLGGGVIFFKHRSRNTEINKEASLYSLYSYSCTSLC